MNTEKKGDFLVLMSPDGDFLLRETDLTGFGISLASAKPVSVEGETYYSLRSLSGISYAFNENKVALDLRIAPELLPKKIVNLFPPRRTDIYYPHDSSIFLNYAVDRSHIAGVDNITATQQLGLQRDNIVVLSDSVYTDNSTSKKFVRLMSSLNIDDRKGLTRFLVGDSISMSGDLGSMVNFGGVTYSKVYRMDPYFLTYPTIHLAGAATLPSDAELYVNGMKVRTEKLPAGGFDFTNITSYLGAGDMELVLRDPFGRVQRISLPFYFTNQLLRDGLHEYSYSAGFERKNFGVESNTYDRFVFSGFHRYGVTDDLTIGANIEGRSDLVTFGGQGNWLIPRFGLLTALGNASFGGDGKNGVAGSAAYMFQSINVNARLVVRGFSPGYTTIAGNPGKNRIRYDTSATVGYATRELGSLSLGATYSAPEKGVQKLLAVSYARNITNTVTFSANYSYGGQNNYESKVLAGITWNFAANTALSARVENTQQSRTEVVEVRKNPPIGEGYGYDALVSHSTGTGQIISTLDTSFQYNGQYGKYIGEYIRTETGTDISYRRLQHREYDYQDNYRLNVAGSVLLLGGRIGFSRPVNDSFALVKVGNVEGVKVSQYAQDMGTTNSRGELFVPDLGSFNDNLVTIKAGNIPLDYSLKTLEVTISPPYRSGSCINFPVKKMQPVTGTLKAKVNGQVKPLELAEMTIDTETGKVIIQTGFGGEFYWEEATQKASPQRVEYGCSAISETIAPAIKPGRYHGTALLENRTYRFEFEIPQSNAMIIELGEVLAEPVKGRADQKEAGDRPAAKNTGTKAPSIGK